MTRQQQITAAMQGRLAAQVNDSRLRDAVRFKVQELCNIMKYPSTPQSLAGYTSAVLQAAAKTIIFEDEVCVALEMGASGELPNTEQRITQAALRSWVIAYAASEDRRKAQEQISINSARDRARMDAIQAEENRRGFEEEGLRRAWQTFLAEGWTFRPGYAAALYNLIGKVYIRDFLSTEEIAHAKAAARTALRHADPRRYRTMPDADLDATPVMQMYWKAQLVRYYFEIHKAKGLDIPKPSRP